MLSKYIHKLGVSPLWSLTDVFGLEPDQLEWMPKPVKAVILLFPDSVSKDIYKFSERLLNDKWIFHYYQNDKHSKDETVPENPTVLSKDIFYMKQYINNACGAIALVHGIANNPE